MSLPRGRVGAALLMTYDRDLTPSDLARLQTQTSGETRRTQVPTVQKFTRTHHMMAQLTARGYSDSEVATMVGRTAQRVGDMRRNDPAFKELVSYYTEMAEEQMVDETIEFTGVVKDIARSAAEEIQDRLSDPVKRDKIPIGELRMLMGDALSRTVLPVKSAEHAIRPPVNITFNVGDKDISQIKPRDEGEIIDLDSEEVKDDNSG